MRKKLELFFKQEVFDKSKISWNVFDWVLASPPPTHLKPDTRVVPSALLKSYVQYECPFFLKPHLNENVALCIFIFKYTITKFICHMNLCHIRSFKKHIN